MPAVFCKDLAKFQITTYNLYIANWKNIYIHLEEYIYSYVNMSYIHVPITLSFTRRK